MCIRDRCEIALPETRAARLRVVIENNDNPPLTFAAGSVSAVSYTHLRAHETVLDLVCRLLLEKKKNTNQRTANVKDEVKATHKHNV